MRKATLLWLAAITLIFSLLACSPSQTNLDSRISNPAVQDKQTAGPVKITFYTYNYTSAQKAGVDMLVDEFQQDNEDIKVEIVFAPAAEINTKIMADVAAGVTPDVIQLIFEALDYGANNFGVQDLNTLVDSGELAAHLKGFEPAAVEVAKLNGKLYGLPYTFSTPVLFYNVALFKQAGLNPDLPPSSWMQVEQYALKIRDITGVGGFVFAPGGNYDWLIQSLFKSNGGNVMSGDRKTIRFGEQPAVEAVSMLAAMRKSGAHAEMINMQGLDAFPKGNLGMILTTSAYQAYFLASAKAAGWDIRTAKMPAFEGKKAIPVNSGSGLFICAKDPAKQQAAWKFLKFVTSERGYTIITTKMGYPPLRPGIVEDEKYLKQWAKENPLTKANLEQLRIVTPWESYPGSNWQQIETILVDAVNKCIFSDVDIARTMQAAQSQAQSLMP